jgi:hypothetical protein
MKQMNNTLNTGVDWQSSDGFIIILLMVVAVTIIFAALWQTFNAIYMEENGAAVDGGVEMRFIDAQCPICLALEVEGEWQPSDIALKSVPTRPCPACKDTIHTHTAGQKEEV